MQPNHFPAEQLIDYFAGVWTPDQERMIETHLADCESCAERARAIYADIEIMDSWTAQAHKQAEVQAAMVKSWESGYQVDEAGRSSSYGGILVSLARAAGAFVGTLVRAGTRPKETTVVAARVNLGNYDYSAYQGASRVEERSEQRSHARG